MATAFSGASVSIQGGTDTLRLFTGSMERLSDGNIVDFNTQVRLVEPRGVDPLETRRVRPEGGPIAVKDARAGC